MDKEGKRLCNGPLHLSVSPPQTHHTDPTRDQKSTFYMLVSLIISF